MDAEEGEVSRASSRDDGRSLGLVAEALCVGAVHGGAGVTAEGVVHCIRNGDGEGCEGGWHIAIRKSRPIEPSHLLWTCDAHRHTQKHPIEHREERRVDANPEGECDDDREGETPHANERTRRVPEILSPGLQAMGASLSRMETLIDLSEVVAHDIDVAELALGLASGLV